MKAIPKVPTEATIRVGLVKISRRVDGTLVLVHDRQPRSVEVNEKQLERWALRLLREGAFA